MTRLWLVLALVATFGSQGHASSAPGTQNPNAAQTEKLAKYLRGYVLEVLPDPLYEDTKKWGMQKENARGKRKNDGRWLKYRLTGREFDRTFQLRIEETPREGDVKRFKVFVDFDANAYLERQTWKMGLRLYSGSTRARFHVQLILHCELTSRVEKGKAWLPDMVFRFKVINSEFKYDHVVVEHTAGVGGDAAQLLGEVMLGVLKAVKPELERDLATKVNKAILKAGDTKEVRVSVSEWLSPKKATGAKPK